MELPKKRKRVKTSKRTLISLVKRARALELRQQGYAYVDIGRDLHCTTQYAYTLVTNALQTLAEQTHEAVLHVRKLEERRLDSMLKGVWPSAITGETLAIASVLKIMERRARLYGLDAPQRFVVNDWETLTDDQLERLAKGEDPSSVLSPPLPPGE